MNQHDQTFKNKEQRIVDGKEWIDAIELPNMVHLLECTARSALYRTESRGVHFRSDFPEPDDRHFKKHIEITRGK